MISIKYTPFDMKDYQRLENYLDKTGQSKNGFIKSLINSFFESGQAQNMVESRAKTPIEEKMDREEHYYPYSWIENENVQFFYDEFGQKVMDGILDEFAGIIEDEVEEILEVKGCGFDEWVDDIKERMEDDEFHSESVEEICKKLKGEMYNTL